MYIQGVIDQLDTQLVIFDLDGTLVDSVPEIALAVDAALEELALPLVGEDQVRLWVGNGLTKLWQRALTHVNAYTDAFLEETYDTLLRHYEQQLNQSTTIYEGVEDLLTCLTEQGIRIAICTNKMARFVPGILKKQGIESYIEYIVGGDTFSEKKPNPLPLKRICEHFDIDTPHALMIGDSQSDAKSANAAEIPAILLEQGYSQGVDLHSLNSFVVKSAIKNLIEEV